MEVTGKVQKIFEVQTFSSGFKKREAVILTKEQYPQPLAIEFTQDRVDLLNQVNVGDDVKISINLRGREWTNPEGVTKYFNSIQGWRIEKIVTENIQASPSGTPTPPSDGLNKGTENLDNDGDVDDLPF